MKKQKKKIHVKTNLELLLFTLPAIIIVFLFNYMPMYGVQIAFKDFAPGLGISGSPWVGFKHFQRFFHSANFGLIIKNTVLLSIYSLLWSFPIPILLALVINEIKGKYFKKVLQTVTYLPYFISMVVLIGMFNILLNPDFGLYGIAAKALGVDSPLNPTTSPQLFRTVYIALQIWKDTGFSSIVYLAVLSGIDPSLHEASMVDGASKLQRIWYIDLPALIPTAVIMFILACGSIMNIGFEKVFLMQNQINVSVSEVISTYVYKVGIQSAQYSFSSAVNLFNTVINLLFVIVVNYISRRVSENSLW